MIKMIYLMICLYFYYSDSISNSRGLSAKEYGLPTASSINAAASTASSSSTTPLTTPSMNGYSRQKTKNKYTAEDLFATEV